MASINEIVGLNIKKIREERGLSLEKLSNLADVSKSMLGQIERGESSPSVTVLWKIANGLKISFEVLTSEAKQEIVKIKKHKAKKYDNDNFRLYPILTYSHERDFELYRAEIESQGRYISNPHPKGTVEYVTVYKGGITIIIEDKEYYIDRGETLQFDADVEHQYLNDSLIQSEFSIMVKYQKK